MCEKDNWNYVYSTISSNGKKFISARGIVGKSGLVAFLKDLPVGDHSLRAFDQSWDTVKNVVCQGEVLTSSGTVLSDDLERRRILDPFDYSESPGFLQPDKVLQLAGVKLEIIYAIGRMLGNTNAMGFNTSRIKLRDIVYVVPRNYGRHLAYIVNEDGGCRLFLAEDHSGELYLDDQPEAELKRPFSAAIKRIHDQLGVADAERVAPAVIYRQCLMEISDQCGKGRLHTPEVV